MTAPVPESLPPRKLGIFTRVAATMVMAVGAIVFIGWGIGNGTLKGIVPGVSPMKANTSLGLVLAGVALRLVADEGVALWRRQTARVRAFVMTLLGLLTLVEYLSGVDLGIDQMLFRDSAAIAHPGRMGFNTACAFALIGEALLLIDERGPRAAGISQGMTLVGLFIALAALIGHAYDVAFLMRLSPSTQMAVSTSLALILLCAGILTSRPQRPLMALALSTGDGGIMVRRIWLQAISLLMLLGWFRLMGEHAGLYNAAFGTGLLVLSGIMLFSFLVWGPAPALERRWRDNARLNQFDRELVSAHELEEMIAAVCRVARELLNADGATFILHEGDQVHYAGENSVAPLWRGRRFPINNCISGWAILERRPAVIEDIDADDRLPHEAYRQTFVKSLAMMPVGPGEPVAAIGVYWAKRHRAGNYEVELLKSVASAADLALANVRAYDLMRRAREQAEAANRLKDEFLATVSHELRTPLNHMLGWVVMLRGGGLEPDRAEEALATIERNARAQNRLIEDLLDMSRIISGRLRLELQPVELGAIVEAAVASARPAAESKGVRLRIEDRGLRIEGSDGAKGRRGDGATKESAFTVLGDADRLQQVFWNLVSNAIKFTPEGGNIVVRLSQQKQPSGRAEVSVSDSGEGIEPKFLPYVFDRFRQADGSPKRRFGGLGLGLAIVRHLIELHGGEVQAESAGQGRGSTFTVRLPLLGAREAISARQGDALSGSAISLPQSIAGASMFESEDAMMRLDGVRVLVVDDEADAQTIITAILTVGGAEVRTAASSAEAMNVLAEWPPDVILSDIGMPGEDGYDFIRRVRAWEAGRDGNGNDGHRPIPAAALTAYARGADRIKALSAGYQSHLAKPIEPAELLAVVISLVRKPGG
jgi:signal transduction histidine kinase/ActR/RegA family two-component response regulator